MSQLPRWVELGALVLALIAGFVNAIGLLGFDHQSVSHLSGTATLLGVGILSGSLTGTVHLVGILLSFFGGAALAGFLLHGSTLKLGRHYDTALVFESALLLASLIFLNRSSFYGHYFASAACGLQNALATTYSGAVLRTTHVTGIFTDLGIMFGGLLRGEQPDGRKAKLFLLIITGFILGGATGSLAFARFHFLSLLAPAAACLLLALVYRLYVNKQR